jgi:hypothetical protein
MKLICVQIYSDNTYVFNSFFSYLLPNLKGLSYEIDFENVNENGQILA